MLTVFCSFIRPEVNPILADAGISLDQDIMQVEGVVLDKPEIAFMSVFACTRPLPTSHTYVRMYSLATVATLAREQFRSPTEETGAQVNSSKELS